MKKAFSALSILLVIMLCSCDINTVFHQMMSASAFSRATETLPLSEKKSVYSGSASDEVKTVYITVLTPQTKDNTVTFEMINEPEPQKLDVFHAIFQEGQAGLGVVPGFYGYGATEANSTIEVKGNLEKAGLRSYKIKFDENFGLWHLNNTINLNKHLDDLSRVKNKFYFDCVSKLDNMAGFRTGFVHLYIKDNSGASPQNEFIDYGIYTSIEQPNKNWLKNHGLDKNASLYKAVNFTFDRRADVIKLTTDSTYDQKEFEKVITAEENENNKKLIAMLDDVNNTALDINSAFDKHFNRKNFLTYTALNILLGNYKNTSQNYYLYSPKGSDIWYFIPWDSEDILPSNEYLPDKKAPSDSFYNVYMYKDNLLYRRFFANEDNLKALDKEIKEIKNKVKSLASTLSPKYNKIMSNYLVKMPDLAHISNTVDLFDNYILEFPNLIEQNYNKYFASRNAPYPVNMLGYTYENGTVTFNWEPSKSFLGYPITYKLDIAREPEIKNIVFSQSNITDTTFKTNLTTGIYYYRITAIDQKNVPQIPFNEYINDLGKKYIGVSQINIK